jgi:hypothetical protein
MLRVLTKCACGCVVNRVARSSVTESTPMALRSALSVKPVGPAPTTHTRVRETVPSASESPRLDDAEDSGAAADNRKPNASCAADVRHDRASPTASAQRFPTTPCLIVDARARAFRARSARIDDAFGGVVV